MKFAIGKVVRKEGSPAEVKVSFWDDAKPEPRDVAEVTVFLRTDETNVLILKTDAMMKAQELIVHVAGTSMGKGDELLNEFILMHESLKGGIAGLQSPVLWPTSPRTYEIPEHVLEWREGDDITEEHRRAMADALINTFNYKPELAAETREFASRAPVSTVAEWVAVAIATRARMDAETFRRTFPTISKSKSLTITSFLHHAGGSDESDDHDTLGE